MSFAHTNAVWQAKLGNSGLKLVALALADMANEAGECWPSVRHLANICEMSSRMVNYHLKTLRAEGIVQVEARHKNGSQRSNMFRFPRVENPATAAGLPQHPLKSISSPGCNGVHPESPVEPPTSKESKEDKDCFATSALSFPATWMPDDRSKEEKLKSIKTPEDYPTELEFDSYLESAGHCEIIEYRSDLYKDLCRNKWHQWRSDLLKWVKIRDWRAYVDKLEDCIANQKEALS